MSFREWLFRWRQREADLDDEVQAHLRMAAQEHVEQGETPEQARTSAVREFGNVTLVKEVTRDMWGFRWLEALLQDLRYGMRQLRRNPGFTVVAVLTLALGISANTAIFSVVNAVLVRSLPYKDADRIVLVWQIEPQLDRAPVATEYFLAWKEQNDGFENMAAGTEGLSRATLTGGGDAEAVRSAPVSSGLLEMLGAQATLGRLMRPEEDVPGHDTVAVLSYGLWQRRFGSNPMIIGKTLTLDGKSREVIGVMPQGFVFPAIWGIKPDLWVPLAPRRVGAPTGHWLYVLARLKPGVAIQRAETEIKALAAGYAKLYPELNPGIGAQVEPLRDYLVRNHRNMLVVLFGVVGFVLLIACANVANLQLARATARGRELAVRAALGAGRTRILRQLLTENVFLSVLGGAAGFLLVLWAKDFLLSLSPPDYLPRASEINISPEVLAFTLGVPILTGVMFGLIPAILGFRRAVYEPLKEGTRSLTEGLGSRSTRSALVVAEISLALILLVGAGMMIRSLQRLAEVHLGFETTNVLTMEVDLPESRYTKPEQVVEFYQSVLERIQGLPGVKGPAFASTLPLGGGPNSTIEIEGAQKSSGSGHGPLVQPTAITLDYFRALRIPLLKGRTFTKADASNSTMVVINERLASYFWPNQDPVGKRLRFTGDSTWLEVMGVVGSSRRWSISDKPMPEVFFAHGQYPSAEMNLVVRSATDPRGLVSAIRSQISAVDSNIPAYAVSTLQQAVSESTAGPPLHHPADGRLCPGGADSGRNWNLWSHFVFSRPANA